MSMNTFIRDLYLHFYSKKKQSYIMPTTFSSVAQVALYWESYHGYGALVSCYRFGEKMEVSQYEIAVQGGYFRKYE